MGFIESEGPGGSVSTETFVSTLNTTVCETLRFTRFETLVDCQIPELKVGPSG